MPAATFDFFDKYRLEQGVYRAQIFRWTDSTGAAVNLTGYTARMQLRKSVSNSEVLLELTTVNGGISITPDTGTVTVIFKDTDTVGAAWVSGVYDLELVDSTGKPTRLIEGAFELSKEVTR
nr:hypothetical protein [uncultured Undibacterium sp.]